MQKEAWHPLGEEELKAFKQAKALILLGSVVKHYLPFRDTRMETNTSNRVVARVLN